MQTVRAGLWWSGLVLTQPHTYWVTLSKLVNLSEPPVLYLRNGDKEGCLCPEVVGRLNRERVEEHVLRASMGESGAGMPSTHPACNCPPQQGPASGTEKIEACPEHTLAITAEVGCDICSGGR